MFDKHRERLERWLKDGMIKAYDHRVLGGPERLKSGMKELGLAEARFLLRELLKECKEADKIVELQKQVKDLKKTVERLTH